MSNLYKGRYLIAVYDEEDNFIDCATSVVGLKNLHKKSVYSQISRGKFWGVRNKMKTILIDCLEKHDDIFAEEDKIFLEEINKEDLRRAELRKRAEQLGITLGTLLKWLSTGQVKIEGGKYYVDTRTKRHNRRKFMGGKHRPKKTRVAGK